MLAKKRCSKCKKLKKLTEFYPNPRWRDGLDLSELQLDSTYRKRLLGV